MLLRAEVAKRVRFFPREGAGFFALGRLIFATTSCNVQLKSSAMLTAPPLVSVGATDGAVSRLTRWLARCGPGRRLLGFWSFCPLHPTRQSGRVERSRRIYLFVRAPLCPMGARPCEQRAMRAAPGDWTPQAVLQKRRPYISVNQRYVAR